MKRNLTAVVWQEGKWFVARCLEVDVASQGVAEADAMSNLHEALELHFRPPVLRQPGISEKEFNEL